MTTARWHADDDNSMDVEYVSDTQSGPASDPDYQLPSDVDSTLSRDTDAESNSCDARRQSKRLRRVTRPVRRRRQPLRVCTLLPVTPPGSTVAPLVSMGVSKHQSLSARTHTSVACVECCAQRRRCDARRPCTPCCQAHTTCIDQTRGTQIAWRCVDRGAWDRALLRSESLESKVITILAAMEGQRVHADVGSPVTCNEVASAVLAAPPSKRPSFCNERGDNIQFPIIIR